MGTTAPNSNGSKVRFRKCIFCKLDNFQTILTVDFFTADTFDVDNIASSVYSGYFAFTTLVGATDNGDFVVLADWGRSYLMVRKAEESRKCSVRDGARCRAVQNIRTRSSVHTFEFLTELLGQRGRHDLAADATTAPKVRHARLASG